MRVAIPWVFLACALWFWKGPWTAAIPVQASPTVDAAELSVGPRRGLFRDPPQVVIGGYAQGCEACHMLFESQPTAERTLLQHQDVQLDHGLNGRCYNCHSIEDRDRLVLHDGRTIPFEQVSELCAQCHGPTFRDWERGVHGKTLGAWDRARPEWRRLTCTECHDPHAPAFPAMAPLPGPHTLRMGSAAHDDPSEPARSPLRRWSNPGGPR